MTKHQFGRYFFVIKPVSGLPDYADVELTASGFRSVFRFYRATPQTVTEFIERNLV